MKKQNLLLLLLPGLLFFYSASAQSVAINDDGSVAHASAMLDVKVTAAAKKGVLVPRMTTAERTAIVAPAKGLLVFDNSTSTFWYFNGSIWQQVSTGNPNAWSPSGTHIYNNNSGNVGIGLNSPKTKLHVAVDKPVLFGADTTGLGTKAFWLPSKAAFRAGRVDDAFMQGVPYYWDYANIGLASFAAGLSTKASGEYAASFGNYTIAAGRGSFSAGTVTSAQADFATAFGEYTTASGRGGFVAGTSNSSGGPNSASVGYGNFATGENSFAANESNTAQGESSSTLGVGNIMRAHGSLAIGTYCDPILAAPQLLIGPATSPLFIIGNGTSNAAKSNAFVVHRSGRTGILRNPAAGQAQDASLQVRSIAGFHALNLESSNAASRWSFAIPGNMSLYYNNALRGTFNNVTGGYTPVSDMRFKKNINALTSVLAGVLQLKTYTYHLIDNAENDPLSYGLMAQEVEKIFPGVVSTMEGPEGKKVYGLNYSNFTVLSIKAIQEQQELIDLQTITLQQQQTQIAQLKNTIDQQQQQINEILKRLEKMNQK